MQHNPLAAMNLHVSENQGDPGIASPYYLQIDSGCLSWIETCPMMHSPGYDDIGGPFYPARINMLTTIFNWRNSSANCTAS